MPNVCKGNKVFISKKNEENAICVFTFIVWVSCLCVLMTLFTLSAEKQVDFAVFKFFERVCNSEFICSGFNKTIEFMFAGINMFWARLGLILARAAITIIITLEGIEKKKTEKNNNKTV